MEIPGSIISLYLGSLIMKKKKIAKYGTPMNCFIDHMFNFWIFNPNLSNPIAEKDLQERS